MPRFARDQESLDADDCLEFVGYLLKHLPDDEADRFRAALAAVASGAAPRAGSPLDPERRAEDARRRHYAQDHRPYRPSAPVTPASTRDFARRFPGAANIQRMG